MYFLRGVVAVLSFIVPAVSQDPTYDPNVCTPDKMIRQTAIACEGKKLSLKCDSGFIQIQWANYGRQNPTICDISLNPNTNCKHSDSSEQKVVQKCNGKTSCSLMATNQEIGEDPCRGTRKYLEVYYLCSQAPVANEPFRPDYSEVTSFEAKVEANILDQNMTVEFTEYFDYDRNMAVLFEYSAPSTFEKAVYDYNTNEIVIQDVYGSYCYIDYIDISDNTFIFGQTTNNGSEHIFSVQAALRHNTGKEKEYYMGKEYIRGILSDRWDSCLYWKEEQTTIKLSWYFSDPVGWNTALNLASVPVRAVVTGSVWDDFGYVDHTFNHYYDFFQFRPIVTKRHPDELFETTPGTVCPYRANTKTVKDPPKYFSFDAEIVQPELKMVNYVKEFYDMRAGLVRYDYKPLPLGSSADLEFGLNPLREVHDFNLGLRYIMDPSLGNCSTRGLEVSNFDSKALDPTTARIKTAKEFFNFDGATPIYQGKHTIRGMETDSWVARRTGYPEGYNINSTFEWYFTRPEWLDNVGQQQEFGEIVRLSISMDAPLNLHSIYNIYNFKETEPAMWSYDIFPCFDSHHRKNFQFALPGNYRGVVSVNLELFKTFTLVALQGSMAVSPLRISHIQVDYNNDNILVRFTLLDVAPYRGNSKNNVTEVTLDVAAELLREAIDLGQLMIEMFVDKSNDPVRLIARPYTLTQIVYLQDADSESKNYTGGVIAAIAIVMIIVGFLLGGGLIYYIYRRNGGTLQSLPFVAGGIDNPNYEQKPDSKA